MNKDLKVTRTLDRKLWGFSIEMKDEEADYNLILRGAIDLYFPGGYEIVAGPVMDEVEGAEFMGFSVRPYNVQMNWKTGECSEHVTTVAREDRAKQQS